MSVIKPRLVWEDIRLMYNNHTLVLTVRVVNKVQRNADFLHFKKK